MYDAGIRLLIVNAFGPHARQQLTTGTEVGMIPEGYHYNYLGRPQSFQINAAVTAIGDLVRRFWLDIEDVDPVSLGNVPTQKNKVDSANRAIEEFDKRGWSLGRSNFGLYTGAWWINQHLPTIQIPALWTRHPLWNGSNYDNDPDIDLVPRGWTEAQILIEQFQGTTDVCGQSVDKNYWIMSRDPLHTEDGEPMTPEERQQLDDATVGVHRLAARMEAAEAKINRTRKEAADHSSLPHSSFPARETVTILRGEG
jgi:hypothetical protein